MPKHKDLNIDDPIKAEHDAMDEAESASVHDVDEAEIADSELLGIEAGSDTGQATPAELAAVHTDTESAHESEGSDAEASEPRSRRSQSGLATEASEPKRREKSEGGKNSKTARPPRRTGRGPAAAGASRSQRYLAASAKIDCLRTYPPAAAFALVKETATGTFDQAVELHIRLLAPKGKKADGERYRAVIALPHGTGKEPKIGILDEALIDKIAKDGDTSFDILIAPPALMPKVAKIAKILGPKNKMPNPKTGTVSDDPDAAKQAIAAGRIELRSDAAGSIHQMIGRVSWPVERLLENYQALRGSLPAHRLRAVSVCATFGPGIHIAL